MTPAQIVRVERVVWLVAFCAVVIALVAVDWRLGLFVAGLLLWASTIDWRRRP